MILGFHDDLFCKKFRDTMVKLGFSYWQVRRRRRPKKSAPRK